MLIAKIFKTMARKLPEPNNASLADIAFMLLIFFLVTTTMNIDTGIPRRLPPPTPPDTEKPPPIKLRNVFEVFINSHNQVMVEGEILMNMKLLKGKVKDFFVNPRNDENLSEKKSTEIEFFGTVRVSKGVVSLQNDRSTEYGKYIEVQNEIVAAVNELRNELARGKWGIDFNKLSKEKKDAVAEYYKLAVSEAQPRDIGN